LKSPLCRPQTNLLKKRRHFLFSDTFILGRAPETELNEQQIEEPNEPDEPNKQQIKEHDKQKTNKQKIEEHE
jgi:hypothetical protein